MLESGSDCRGGVNRIYLLKWVFPIVLIFAVLVSGFSLMTKAPSTPKKRNITFHYDINSTLSEAGLPSFSIVGRQKKLRRLPHIFNRVLELPFNSEADVVVEENDDCFRFAMMTDRIPEDVRAQLIEIMPGVTKIVLRGHNLLELPLDDLELDMWRFRLPPSTRPELAQARYVGGELIVIVPKNVLSEDSDEALSSDEDEEGPARENSFHDMVLDSHTRGQGNIGGVTGSMPSLGDCKTNNGVGANGSPIQQLVSVQ